MQTKPHQGAGVEVWGVDLRTMDDDVFQRVNALFRRHGLVFFRDQQLGEHDHISLARRFGTINVNRFFVPNPRYPEIAMVVKEPDQRANIGGGWHTDHSYDEEPALGSILVARELPESGGDTWFVNMADAFDRLPDALKRKLRTMNAVHSSKHIFGTRGAWLRRLVGSQDQVKNPELADAMDDVVHPVVVRHPLSGREVLYVNPGFTIRFEHHTVLGSMPLLGYLYAEATRSRHVAKFAWEPGSVALWDNRATWHYAKNDYAGQRRVMHRITIDGCALEPALAS
ncbi:MAG: TauD/TfdA family dioxygenase [Polyangiales bacterium]|nr:TauD/TfdA family dioxygenase [Myxococcales bacterium]MCB9658317.1 TauD/TfdA family dioxygenase [Sandaracinaceae bacterium]